MNSHMSRTSDDEEDFSNIKNKSEGCGQLDDAELANVVKCR